MKLNKILQKLKEYLERGEIKEARRKEVGEINEILKEKRKSLKSQIKSSEKSEEKYKLQKELNAILKLIKKSEKVI